MFYGLGLWAWWLVVANPHRIYNTSGNHPLRFPLCLLSRDRLGKGGGNASEDGLGKTFLLVGRTWLSYHFFCCCWFFAFADKVNVKRECA